MTPTSLHRFSGTGSAMRWSVLAVAMALAAVNAVHAASIFEFDRWMQRIEKRALSLQKNLEREDVAASAVDAADLEKLYELMQAYFERRGGAAQAVQLSQRGREAAATIVQHVAASNFEAAGTAVRRITSDCRTCHKAYKPL